MRQAFQHQLLDPGAYLWYFDPSDNFVGKTVDQKRTRHFRIDTARAQVEKTGIVKLADRCTMCAFHVIGENFQLRFGIRFGLPRQQKIVVDLVGIRLDGTGMDDHLAIEYAMRLSVQNAPVILTAGTRRGEVVNAGMMIHMLFTIQQVQAIEGAQTSWIIQACCYVVARQAPAKDKRMRDKTAARRLLCVYPGNMERRAPFLHQLAMPQLGIG